LTDEIKLDRASARKTTLTVAIVLLLAGAWQVYRARPLAAEIFISIGAALAVIGVAIPPLAMAFHRGWMGFAARLGAINTKILLTVVYFLVFAPAGAWRRFRGYDPLERRVKSRPSYWSERTSTRQTREGFERAF
jgi:hypothetical protein